MSVLCGSPIGSIRATPMPRSSWRKSRSVAQQLKMQLAARQDADGIQAHRKVENALGVASEDGGGSSNAKALQLLQSGFKNKPPVHYYQGGDTPTLPDELEGMITAELLGPSPKDSGGEFAASDNKTEQYLSALADNGVPDASKDQALRYAKMAGRRSADYPAHTFDEFDTALDGGQPKGNGARIREGSRSCSPTRLPPPPINWTAH